MDFMFLAYSLPSLMQRFQISKVEAGSLASYTLLGMAVGVDWRLGGLSLRPRSRGGVDDHVCSLGTAVDRWQPSTRTLQLA